MSDSNEVVTDPRLEKRTRRRLSVTEKKRLLAEADALGPRRQRRVALGLSRTGFGKCPSRAHRQMVIRLTR